MSQPALYGVKTGGVAPPLPAVVFGFTPGSGSAARLLPHTRMILPVALLCQQRPRQRANKASLHNPEVCVKAAARTARVMSRR